MVFTKQVKIYYQWQNSANEREAVKVFNCNQPTLFIHLRVMEKPTVFVSTLHQVKSSQNLRSNQRRRPKKISG